jgi:hypothetical protein
VCGGSAEFQAISSIDVDKIIYIADRDEIPWFELFLPDKDHDISASGNVLCPVETGHQANSLLDRAWFVVIISVHDNLLA